MSRHSDDTTQNVLTSFHPTMSSERTAPQQVAMRTVIVPLSLSILLISFWSGASFSLFFPKCFGRQGVALAMSSRLEGNQRSPSAKEIALMDEMIDKLVEAKPYELPSAVKRAYQVIRSPQFFLRIAQRSDEAEDEDERHRFQNLASNLVTTLDAVVETTTEKLDERAESVEQIVKAAAEPDSGEFLVPLTNERIVAMQTALNKLPESSLDEGFLVTLDAWIVKSHQDGMDLMVGILQKVLQMYAGLQIQRALVVNRQAEDKSNASPQPLLEEFLKSDANDWDSLLGSKSQENIADLKKLVQRTMEAVVLSLETGSMAQQVQAEYLKELLQRVETVENRAT